MVLVTLHNVLGCESFMATTSTGFLDELCLCLRASCIKSMAKIKIERWELVDCLIDVFLLQDSNTFLAALQQSMLILLCLYELH